MVQLIAAASFRESVLLIYRAWKLGKQPGINFGSLSLGSRIPKDHELFHGVLIFRSTKKLAHGKRTHGP